MAQVIELEDIYTALSSSKPTLYKAIVSLIFSSSMSTSTISRLTLYDFLYACDEYFEAEEEKIFDNLLKKNHIQHSRINILHIYVSQRKKDGGFR